MFAWRPAAWLVVVLAMLAACSRTPAHRPGEEWLTGIKFEGNHELHDKDLVTGLALRRSEKRGRPPDPYTVQVDADRIRGEYLRHGYLDVDVRSRVERKGDATTVIYTIDEGVRARTRVVITGLPHDPELSVSEVRALLPLADGAPFDYEVYDQAKDKLKAVVEDAGYAHVKLDPLVVADRANHTAIVQLAYTPGPKSTFGAIEIHGVEGELRDAVEARLQMHPGQRYSTAAISATQQALYALNRFSTVRVQPDRDDAANPVISVKVDVAESARHEVKFGGGFAIEPVSYEVRGRVGYSVAGWPFPLDTLSLDLRPAYAKLRDTGEYEPRVRALARIERQDVLWTYASGDVEGGYSYIAVEAYTSFGPRARIGFSTPLGTDRVTLRLGWAIERLDFRQISPLLDPALRMQLGLDHPERDGAYHQALAIDLRDDPIEPTRGVYGELRVFEGTKYAGGAFDYFELVPDVRGYVPLGPVVFAARLRTGTFYGEIPVTHRFYAGGAASQRGFSERRLSPSVNGIENGKERNIPFGGGALFETSVEVRFPVTKIKEMPLGGVVFLDGADVTETRAELDLGNLNWAIGGGLRLHTIVGPVRFDFGYRLNRKGGTNPDPNSSYAFHLSIGEAF